MSTTRSVSKNGIAEWYYTSGKRYPDPYNEVELDVVFTGPDGTERKVPTFWAGEGSWGVRYASSTPGLHHYRSVCSDASNPDLHGLEGALEVTPYEGAHPLQKHGRLATAADHRHLQHVDGTPFLWLGDTWWMGFTRRLSWPTDFQELAADRVAKGFSVVQIVAGLYPDMGPFDARGANEAGYPWEPDFSHINPAYFDMADLRVAHLVRSGLVPCIVGEWGYFMAFAGIDVLKKHWRNLIARYGAYPVVWCLAGEALMTYYVKSNGQEGPALTPDDLRRLWGELAGFVRETDPWANPITIHPTQFGHEQVADPSVLDIDMLQTGHGGFPTLTDNVNGLEKALSHEPKMPVLVGEVNYEGIMESSREEIQRFLFWSSMLSGAAGHTYGANGIWQVNTAEQPYGPSPHGSSWGDTPWDVAYKLPGSGQLGLGKRLLERYAWWQFESHPEWIEPHQTPENRLGCYAAGIPGQVHLVFIPAMASWIAWRGALVARGLEPGRSYRTFYFDPKTGVEYPAQTITPSEQGEYVLPKPPIFQDWIFICTLL